MKKLSDIIIPPTPLDRVIFTAPRSFWQRAEAFHPAAQPCLLLLALFGFILAGDLLADFIDWAFA